MTVRHAREDVRPSAQDVRDLCFETNGSLNVTDGTNLRQVGSAIDQGWGVDLDIRTPMGYDAMWARLLDRSLVAILQIRYLELRGMPGLYNSRAFPDINHAVTVSRDGNEMVVWDPMADRRSPEIARAPVRTSPDNFRRATAQLMLNPSGTRVLGQGKVNVGFVRGMAVPAMPAEVRVATHRVKFGVTAFWVYTEGAAGLTRESKRFQNPTSAPCGSPRWMDFNDTRRRLVRVTDGVLQGRLVEPGRHDVELTDL